MLWVRIPNEAIGELVLQWRVRVYSQSEIPVIIVNVRPLYSFKLSHRFPLMFFEKGVIITELQFKSIQDVNMKKLFIIVICLALTLFLLNNLSARATELQFDIETGDYIPLDDGTDPEQIIRSIDPDAEIYRLALNSQRARLRGVTVDELIAILEDEGYNHINVATIEGAINPTAVLAAGNRMITLKQSGDYVTIIWDDCERGLFPLLDPTDTTDTGEITVAQLGLERITEVDNPLNGMCYIYKLSDGSAVIVDGGHFGNVDKLFEALGSLDIAKDGEGRYRISCWILTHGHSDHYGALFCFVEQYRAYATIESYMHSLPTDEEVLSPLECDVPSIVNWFVQRYPDAIEITPHAGLKYHFDNLTVNMLYTPDLRPDSNYTNDTSLIFTLECDGARVLHMGDAGELAAKACWSEYEGAAFRSDMLQITHHGFTTGVDTPHEWEYIGKIYDATDASVGLLPMGTRYAEDIRNGRYTVLVEWGSMGTHVSFLLDDGASDTNLVLTTQAEYDRFVADVESGATTKTLWGYDGVNVIYGKNGMKTYIMSAESYNMATLFSLSGEGAELILNQPLEDWLK